MVVRTMMGQTSQPDSKKNLEFHKMLSFKLVNDDREEICRFPVAVKNLTTAGAILEILHLDEGLKTNNFKGCDGILQIIAQDDRTMVEVPGKILWTRNRENGSGVTLGVEVLEPLPLSVRQTLESNLPIGAKDMKVLWDYWDEIQESAVPDEKPQPVKDEIPKPVKSVTPALKHLETSEVQADIGGRGNWLYWVGFGAIISGLGMQFPQSEYLGFSGLLIMFSGSILVACKSVISMWQPASSGPTD
jgi:hypothetical protein